MPSVKGRNPSPSRAVAVRLHLGVATLSLIACTEHAVQLDHVGGTSSGSGAASGATGGSGGSDAGGTAGSDSGLVDAGCTIDPAIVEPVLPCEIDAILEAKCRRCHTSPMANGAPFPLLTWQDLQLVPPPGTKRVHEKMVVAVETDFMPFCAEGACGTFDPPVEALTPQEKQTLLDWLSPCPTPADGVACP